MFNTNVTAAFETEKHSIYKVDAKGLTRDKVADPNRKTERKEKNIFYAEAADAATILDLTDPDRKVTGWKLTSVISVMEDMSQLILVQRETGKKAIFDVSRAPALGKQPVDFFCDANGQIPDHAERHVGHKIVKMNGTGL